MATRIKLRRGTAAAWTTANPVLAEGEPGVALDVGPRLKVGDGVRAWASLPYVGPVFDGGAMGALAMRDTGAAEGYSWLPSAAGVLVSAGAGQIPVFRPLEAADIPALPYAPIDLTGTIVNGDIVSVAWSKVTGAPTSLAGYGITDPIVLTSGSYANPAWITSLAYGKLTGTPTLGNSAALNVGTAAGTVAAGDHLHTGVYEPVFGTLGVAKGGTGTATAFTAGSIVFAGASGIYAQDNANLFWDDTNNRLGIGTATPARTLEVYDASGAAQTAQIKFGGTSVAKGYLGTFSDNTYFSSGGTYSSGWAADSATRSIAAITMSGASGGSSIDFQTAATDNTAPTSRMSIDKNGRVGIGTAPASPYALNVAGEGRFTGALTVGGAFTIGGLTVTGTGVVSTFGNGGTGSTLTVVSVNGGSATGGGPYIVFKRNSVDVGYVGASGALDGSATDDIDLYAKGAIRLGTNSFGEKVRIDTTGRIGVGVTAPTAFVHLKAGSATASTAPLKFNSGTLLTTAEAGSVEFLTDDFFATITTGAARKAFVLDDGARLTIGKIPIASTNGRLIDGPTPLSGTKVYYVSDTSGGAVTRKITFTNGILTAET